jgi:hypothetical protein
LGFRYPNLCGRALLDEDDAPLFSALIDNFASCAKNHRLVFSVSVLKPSIEVANQLLSGDIPFVVRRSLEEFLPTLQALIYVFVSTIRSFISSILFVSVPTTNVVRPYNIVTMYLVLNHLSVCKFLAACLLFSYPRYIPYFYTLPHSCMYVLLRVVLICRTSQIVSGWTKILY